MAVRAEVRSASILMGMLYEDAFDEKLFREVQEMKESTAYQSIPRCGVERGETLGIRGTILLRGRLKFGAPSAEPVQSLEGIADRERLRELAARILSAPSWQPLLA